MDNVNKSKVMNLRIECQYHIHISNEKRYFNRTNIHERRLLLLLYALIAYCTIIQQTGLNQVLKKSVIKLTFEAYNNGEMAGNL